MQNIDEQISNIQNKIEEKPEPQLGRPQVEQNAGTPNQQR